MKITSAKFIKGVVGPDAIFDDGIPQIAFIGRSNVGKSSTINALVSQGDLARTSSFPGRTQEINVFLINESFYLVDLPGYGFAKASKEKREFIKHLIYGYFFNSYHTQKKVVLIIDANVGATKDDIEMLQALEEEGKSVVIITNKIDKVKKSELKNQLYKIGKSVGEHKVIPFSSKEKTNAEQVREEVFN